MIPVFPPDRTVQRCARLAMLLVLPLMLTGCAHSPSFNILGSYFPSWIVCCGIAVALTFALHLWLTKKDLAKELWPLPVVYVSSVVFLTCTLWSIFFN